MEKNHRHPGRDGGGKRSLECVWNNPKYTRTAAAINNATSRFDKLTVETVLAQYRAGTLPEGVLLALLAGVGLLP
jgi:hypothetical protein